MTAGEKQTQIVRYLCAVSEKQLDFLSASLLGINRPETRQSPS